MKPDDETRQLIASIVVVVAAATFTVWSYQYGGRSGIFPRLVGWATLGLALLDLVIRARAVMAKMRAATATGDDPGAVPVHRHLLAVGWVVSFVAAMYLIGFHAAIFAFVLAYMTIWGRNPHFRSFCVAAGATLVIYVTFDVLLLARLPGGVLF